MFENYEKIAQKISNHEYNESVQLTAIYRPIRK